MLKMLKLMKLHRNYLFNKVNIVIILSFLFITLSLCLIVANPLENSYTSWFNREARQINYEYAFMFFIKIMMVFVSCFLFIMFYNKSNDNYYLLFASYFKKDYFYITKLITICSFIFLLLISLFLIYISVGTFFTNWFFIKSNLIKSFICIYYSSLVYGVFSLVLSRIWDSLYVLIIPISFFFLCELTQDIVMLKNINQYIQLFFPTVIISSTIDLFYNIYQVLIIMCLYSMIGYVCYVKK